MSLVIGSYLFDWVDWKVVIGNDNWYIVTTSFCYDS
jgi:hypothetical protein